MRKREFGFSLIELMIVVAIMGILVAVALPQYQNYQVRSKVTEALVMGTSVQRALVSYYNSKGMWPLSNDEAGLPAAGNSFSTYIKKIKVQGTNCGHFKIKLKNDTGLGKLKGRWLWMKPLVSTDGGSIRWDCRIAGSSSVVNSIKNLVPKECRNRANGTWKSCP